MKMYHYTSKSGGNFGDELNVWMWPQLIPHAFDGRDEAIFLGIGSILFDHFPSDQKKVVMGAGYAGYSGVPTIDLSWKIYFLRGRLTARALGVDERLGIGDAAILLRSCKLPSPKKRFKVSFMPHWESLPRGNWQEVCNRADVQLIDPRSDVDTVLEQLLASERVVTEAMHGAIVCDALRIPWIAIEPVLPIHRMKWYDWASALDLELRPLTLVGSTAYEWPSRVRKHQAAGTGESNDSVCHLNTLENRFPAKLPKDFGFSLSSPRVLVRSGQFRMPMSKCC